MDWRVEASCCVSLAGNVDAGASESLGEQQWTRKAPGESPMELLATQYDVWPHLVDLDVLTLIPT